MGGDCCGCERLRHRSCCNTAGLAVLSTVLTGGLVLLLFLFAFDGKFSGSPGFTGHWSNYLFGVLAALSLSVTVWLWIRYGCWVALNRSPASRSQYLPVRASAEERQREPLVPRKRDAVAPLPPATTASPSKGYQQQQQQQHPSPVDVRDGDDDRYGDPALPAWAREDGSSARRTGGAPVKPSYQVVPEPDPLVDLDDPNLPAWARE